MTDPDRAREATERAQRGNLEKEGEKLARQEAVRPRSPPRLLDEDSFEGALLANALAGDLPADGVITGTGRVDRPPGVRRRERSNREGGLVGRAPSRRSCGSPSTRCGTSSPSCTSSTPRARITDQVELFPGRRGAGRIFFANQVRLSGKVPQVCCLFGRRRPVVRTSRRSVMSSSWSRATSMYLGSPRIAEVVIGEHISLEEMGGAPHARDGQRLRRQPVHRRRRRDRPGSPLPLVPADELDARTAGRGPVAPIESAKAGRDTVPVEAACVRHAQRGRCTRRCGLVLRDQAAVGAN
jgi:acetyl-CoA carboxylase carboxyltransferase component